MSGVTSRARRVKSRFANRIPEWQNEKEKERGSRRENEARRWATAIARRRNLASAFQTAAAPRRTTRGKTATKVLRFPFAAPTRTVWSSRRARNVLKLDEDSRRLNAQRVRKRKIFANASRSAGPEDRMSKDLRDSEDWISKRLEDSAGMKLPGSEDV